MHQPIKPADNVSVREASQPSPKLRVNEAARHLGLAVSTMNKMRLSGLGPRFIRLTRKRVAYDLADLEAWVS
jgi:predicted DNA-binding transcriptional regulator AlpA